MMTSMIDVVFLLLIFFVCAAAGTVHEVLLPSHLAGGGTASVRPEQAPEPIDEVWVYLKSDAGGQLSMSVNGTSYQDLGALEQTLRALADIDAASPVILDIASEVAAGDMIRVYDRCRSAGFTAIHFNTRSVPSE